MTELNIHSDLPWALATSALIVGCTFFILRWAATRIFILFCKIFGSFKK